MPTKKTPKQPSVPKSARALARWLGKHQTTQRMLTARLKVSDGYVSMLIYGRMKPSLKVARDIEDITEGAVTMRGWV